MVDPRHDGVKASSISDDSATGSGAATAASSRAKGSRPWGGAGATTPERYA